MNDEPIIEARDLRRQFAARGRKGVGVRAVDGVDFEIRTRETVGLIGESGCGKTTTARLLLGLEKPTGGAVHFRGRRLEELDRSGEREYRRSVQAVFQDPQSSLNPRLRVGTIIAEPMKVAGELKPAELRHRLSETLAQVGLDESALERFPHQFSGGQRQRIAIARALAIRPKLVVLDEPVASLDVSIRSQILALLRDLQSRFEMSYLLISHDLATAAQLCDRVAVMYLGRIVETGTVSEIYDSPRHPFTQELLSAARFSFADDEPASSPVRTESDAAQHAAGCHFRSRCPLATAVCAELDPALRPLSADHQVACHNA